MKKNKNFLESGIKGLLNASISHNNPLYVQYYITARCNLRCKQCNVIYANADVGEISTSQALKVIDNLGEIGTNVLLFTGGEPFVRNDLPLLVERAIKNGIHPRIQTNGLATIESLKDCIDKGVRDISISLDSLLPPRQDYLNGEFLNSWDTAIDTISNVSQLFPEDSFCALGCVFSPTNFREVKNVIKFADAIGWWVSLVPAHSTSPIEPRSFSSFDKSMLFNSEILPEALNVLNEIISLKKKGSNVYDSYEFLENIKLFIQGKPTNWRRRNNGMCDSPNLYFAILPDGTMAPCCDWRFDKVVDVSKSDFPSLYQKKDMNKYALPIIKKCSGCMYGSYPEISISTRFASAALERFSEFVLATRPKIKRFSKQDILAIAEEINSKNE